MLTVNEDFPLADVAVADFGAFFSFEFEFKTFDNYKINTQLEQREKNWLWMLWTCLSAFEPSLGKVDGAARAACEGPEGAWSVVAAGGAEATDGTETVGAEVGWLLLAAMGISAVAFTALVEPIWATEVEGLTNIDKEAGPAGALVFFTEVLVAVCFVIKS